MKASKTHKHKHIELENGTSHVQSTKKILQEAKEIIVPILHGIGTIIQVYCTQKKTKHINTNNTMSRFN